MKIHIYYPLKKGPWGGGNQFLRALQKEFKKSGNYAEAIEDADAVLFNSHHQLSGVVKLRRKHPNTLFVHRIDGPLSKIRGTWLSKMTDKVIFYFSDVLSQITILQSGWSKKVSEELGYRQKEFDTVIFNASDELIFNREGKKEFKPQEKIKIIATSWSANMGKGFDVYDYMDKNLDFDKYQFTFIGNTPIKFENIKHIEPVPSEELAKYLKDSDIFITASKNDPCSNSLIEALSSGLPVIVRNDGGHPELMRGGGESFDKIEEVIEKLEKVAANYENYQSNIPEFDMEKTAKLYYAAIEKAFESSLKPKKVGTFKSLLILLSLKMLRLA